MKKKEKKHLGTNHVLLGVLFFVLVFVVAADLFFLLSEKKEDVLGAAVELSSESVATVGPAYDWTTGEVLYDFKDQTKAPDEAGWFYYDTSQRTGDGITAVSGVWLPEGSPRVGSRNLTLGDAGDDVRAIQTSLNAVRPDKEDDFAFNELKVTGGFDTETENAVKAMQRYYNLEDTGICGSDFVKNLLNDITSVEG